MKGSLGIVFRSCLFAAVQLLITPPYSLIALGTFPLPPLTRYRIIRGWARLMLVLVERICGIRYRVLGTEHIPSRPCVMLSKHQSAWETMAFQAIFPPQVQVIKRELLWIPFFGWGLAMVSPIAIDRASGVRALKQMIEQGKDRLKRGFWIIVYPEGTRMAPGARGKYQTGGAAIAVHAGAPVVPVAHNAGQYWRRNAFLKYPGTITVSIGRAIDSRGMKAEVLTREAESWIESEMPRLDRADGPA
jgi:1-acyl-sn-glycerol-3-phosphate acyltransferase